ncbi:MAG: response regulator [Pseudomonadota bacterium]
MTTSQTVLIVEDEPKIAAILRDYFVEAGYQTHWLESGATVADWVRAHEVDMVLLDLMLPGMDGLAVCKALREFSAVPIIFVTARVEEIDRLLGLELGADDYICKPFSPREVVARVKAVLRRVSLIQQEPGTDYRGLRLDDERFEASFNGATLDLTPVEFRLLKRLCEQPGRVFSRAQLMSTIYLDGRVVSDRTVDSHVKNLRHKMTDAGCPDDMIHSIYGVGYKME